ncbi:c-type cytochrome [Flavobacterium faecale]|uniref:c-type cytochrome n=1 Tax=Flavobacterium faecale TaxID=1355330 RepID=UPI003AAE0CDA
MRKILKKAIKIISIIAIVALIGYLYIKYTDIPKYETVKVDYKIKSDSVAVARGKKLAVMLCASCHLDIISGKLTGGKMTDAPIEFGEIYAPNITQDKNYGIGNWTDAEILYLLRTGIKKDGQYAPPYMAKLPKMADEDINAIISFLRSDDPLVTAEPTPDQPSKPSTLTKLLSRFVWKPFEMPTEKIVIPDTTNTVALGKYLTTNLDCFACHSANFKTNDYLNPENSKGYFAGGNKPLNREGKVRITPNITPDKETGIGTWSKEKFIKAVKFGVVDDHIMVYPMMPYTLLTDTEVGAIYDYIQTIPPIKNKIERVYH